MIFGIYLGLVFLAYLVPFTILSRVTRVWGSFLFFIVFALLCLVLLVKIMSTWDHEH